MTTTFSDSTLSKKQEKTYRATYNEDGYDMEIIATVRHDDSCGNGHNTFSITAEIRENGRLESCGCLHEDIAKHFPELAPLIKWHLCSTDGPLHYIANTLYHAGDRDHWGLRKGEKKQVMCGGKTPSWILTTEDGREADVDGIKKHVDSHDQPKPPANGLVYSPWWHVGEGKERDLDAARHTAIWPDATDNDLTEAGLKDRLLDRLPGLMKEFRAAVESLGLVY